MDWELSYERASRIGRDPGVGYSYRCDVMFVSLRLRVTKLSSVAVYNAGNTCCCSAYQEFIVERRGRHSRRLINGPWKAVARKDASSV